MTISGRASAPKWREQDRLAALERYRIMDTLPEQEFDDLARVAAQICGVPIALITLVDDRRQWFKAKLGFTPTETPRDIAFCDYAIKSEGLLQVPDATLDERFADNLLVAGDENIRFYAGAPIVTPDGLPLGTLCVLDRQPRELSDAQQDSLMALSRQVTALLELRLSLAQQRADQRRNSQILESAVDYGIVSMDLSGMVTSWNEGARRIFGWTHEEMCGRPCDEFFTPEDRDDGVPQREMGNALQFGRGKDERWHLRKDGELFWANGEMMPLTDEDEKPIGFIKILRDRTEERRERERQEEHRELLTNELKHRIKNTLSVVQAIVSQSLRNVATPAEARDAIGNRLATLANAHDLLTQTSWSAAPMAAIIAGAVAVLGERTERIAIAGPDIRLNARAALALAMTTHELCTNAAKYGALSNETGRVEVSWVASQADGDAVIELVWQEMGGPTVVSPSHKGFGSKLVEGSLARDLGGKGVLDYQPGGLRWTLAARRHVIEEG